MIKIVLSPADSFLLASCGNKNQSSVYSDMAITSEQQILMILKHNILRGLSRGH